jgi:hypothetical protein
VRVTSLAIALKPRSQSPAIAAVKKATSRANAQIKNLAVEVAGVPAVADTQVAEAKNATNVVKSGISLAIALKVVPEATAVATVVDTAAAAEVAVAVAEEDRPATPVAGSVTCPGTAPKGRSATTVSGLFSKGSDGAYKLIQAAKSVTFLVTAPRSHPASASATSASSQATSRLLAPTKTICRRLASTSIPTFPLDDQILVIHTWHCT